MRYRVVAAGAARIHVELRYQPIGYRWAQNLAPYKAAEPQKFVRVLQCRRVRFVRGRRAGVESGAALNIPWLNALDRAPAFAVEAIPVSTLVDVRRSCSCRAAHSSC